MQEKFEQRLLRGPLGLHDAVGLSPGAVSACSRHMIATLLRCAALSAVVSLVGAVSARATDPLDVSYYDVPKGDGSHDVAPLPTERSGTPASARTATAGTRSKVCRTERRH